MKAHPPSFRFVLALAPACVLLAAGPVAAAVPEVLAREVLSEAVTDAGSADGALALLSGTDDIELIPLFVKLRRSESVGRRRLALDFLRRVAGERAAPILRQRLTNDPEPRVRLQVLAYLLDDEVATEADLAAAAEDEDPRIRLLAARGLLGTGEVDKAQALFTELADVDDTAVADSARLGLLATGDASQLAHLRAVATRPGTRADLLASWMGQIAQDEIASAAPLARDVATSDRDPVLRTLAWEALSATLDAPAELRRAVASADTTRMRLNLVRVLADRDDAAGPLRSLADGAGPVAAAARLELARRGGDLTAATLAATRLGHAGVVEYLLARGRQDVEDGEADGYVDALIEVVQSAPADAVRPTLEHRQAAAAAALLVDIGHARGLAALEEILSGPYNALQRAVATGLHQTDDPAACRLAAHVVDSPYRELAADAALVLGRHERPEALPGLGSILRHAERHPAPVRILSSWYVLLQADAAEAAARQLAEELK